MLRAIADTHAVIWYLEADPRLSPSAKRLIEATSASGDQIGFSTVTVTEMICLIEKGRVLPVALQYLLQEVADDGGVLREVPLDLPIALAMIQIDRAQVPDLPDRIISATALFHNLPLITRDHRIRATSLTCIW